MAKILRDLTQVDTEMKLTPDDTTTPTTEPLVDQVQPTAPAPVTLESLQAQIAALTAALNPKDTKATKVRGPKAPKADTKQAQIVGLLNRVGGCTNEEAKEILGWPAISLKTQAANMGIEMRSTKEGRQIRYYAVTEEAKELAAAEQAEMDRLTALEAYAE